MDTTWGYEPAGAATMHAHSTQGYVCVDRARVVWTAGCRYCISKNPIIDIVLVSQYLYIHAPQVVLHVRGEHPAQPGQHVRELHQDPGGHHGRHPEAGQHSVVQGLRAVPAAAQALAARGAREQGAADLLCQACAGPQPRQAGGRGVHLDGAALDAPQGQADHPGRGAQRRHPAAGLPGGVCGRAPHVPLLQQGQRKP